MTETLGEPVDLRYLAAAHISSGGGGRPGGSFFNRCVRRSNNDDGGQGTRRDGVVAYRTFRGGPVEARHEMMRLLDVHPEFALVQVGNEDPVPALGGDALRLRGDVLGDSPPLLEHDHRGRGLLPALVSGNGGVAEGDLIHDDGFGARARGVQ